jgi:hypothetical protein
MASVGITGLGVYVPRYPVAPATGGGRAVNALAPTAVTRMTEGRAFAERRPPRFEGR